MVFPILAKIKHIFKHSWRIIVLCAVAACFFIGASCLNYFTQSENFIKWLSPDESANYIFSKLYAQENELAIFEKYDTVTNGIVRPRSFKSDSGLLKPVSFLGMILIYGKLAGWTTYKILPFLTPAFAAVGIVFYYLLIKRIFGTRNGFMAALILSVFPPFVYYSARSMFHNVLFAVMLVMGFYFAYLSTEKKKFIADSCAALAGAFFGFAAITRSSELIWLIPVLAVIWLFNIKKFGFMKPIIFIACAFLAVSPAMYWNKILYQSYWRGGYNEINQSISNIMTANDLAQIKNNVFIFGFHPLKSLKALYFYFAKMFYWIFWPAFFGFMLMASKIKKWKKKHFAYMCALAVLSAILILYYGSWDFHDNPDPKSRTIGNSYVRYWLPIYLGSIPLAAVFFAKLSNVFRKKFFISAARALLVCLMFAVSIKFVLFGSEEGLAVSARKQLSARSELDRILNLTENRSVIITQYHDKLFFPERKVIVGLFDDANMVRQYATLAKYLPVYYYNFTFPANDFNYLNGKKLPQFGLKVEAIEKVTENFTLYKLFLQK